MFKRMNPNLSIDNDQTKMSLNDLPDLAIEKIIHFLSPIDILRLRNTTSYNYCFLQPIVQQLPIIDNIFSKTEKQISKLGKLTNDLVFDDNWSKKYAHFGFFIKLYYNIFNNDLNLTINFWLLKSRRFKTFKKTFVDFFKDFPTKQQNNTSFIYLINDKDNLRVLFQPQQIIIFLDTRGIILKIPSFEFELRDADYYAFYYLGTNKIGTILDGCNFIDSRTLQIYQNGLMTSTMRLPISVYSFFDRHVCLNNQHCFIVDHPFYFIDYLRKISIQQRVPRGVYNVDCFVESQQNYYAFVQLPSTISVYHMNHSITYDNIWVWKKINEHKRKNRNLTSFVYCPVLNKIYEI